MPLSRHLLIAGQAAPDLFCFRSSAQHSAETTPPLTKWLRGGASLVAHLLSDFLRTSGVNVHIPEFAGLTVVPSSLIELSQQFDSDAFTVDLVRKLSIDSQSFIPTSLPPPGSEDNKTVYVFRDGENHFHETDGGEKALKLLETHLPSYFIYHMSRPLCEGQVWDRVRPRGSATNRLDPERLVVIVQADDLRAAGVELSQGSSWEKICEEFVRNIGAVSNLVTLVTCPHLIVVFGCDGLIYHRGLDVLKPVLFFDPLRTEGDFIKQNKKVVPGTMEAFVAGFSRALILSDKAGYEHCIEAGFQTSRQLARKGLSPSLSIYKNSAIMTESANEDALMRFDIPSDEIGMGEMNWSLLDSVIADAGEIARRIVLEGISKVNIPLSRINRLVLFDRKEIQLFHTLQTHLGEYLAFPQNKPLSIALFGPRGSGKTFAALQVAEAAAGGGKKLRSLIFDLSEFRGLEDLVEAFHQIRDCALDGYTALAYFKNFDASSFGSKLGWLAHLLPAMANGRFFDGAVSRPLGTALLFFGTSAVTNFTHFEGYAKAVLPNSREAQKFVGCLQGCVDIAGFNRAGVGDKLYLFQRAVVLRAILEERAPKLKSGNKMNVDEKVLSGLLLVSEYFQGIHSLKAIVTMSHLNNARHFSLSALPSQIQLQLHVDHGEFVKARSGSLLPTEVRELLAKQLHQVYCHHIRERERAKPDNRSMSDEQIDEKNGLKPWHQLLENFKESNRKHADAIPSTIRIVSCFLAEKKHGREPMTNFAKMEIEAMAIHEKGRWNSERLQSQWRAGPRSGTTKRTPYLVPWEDLDDETKSIDRAMVESYPKIIPPNYAIYRMDSRA